MSRAVKLRGWSPAATSTPQRPARAANARRRCFVRLEEQVIQLPPTELESSSAEPTAVAAALQQPVSAPPPPPKRQHEVQSVAPSVAALSRALGMAQDGQMTTTSTIAPLVVLEIQDAQYRQQQGHSEERELHWKLDVRARERAQKHASLKVEAAVRRASLQCQGHSNVQFLQLKVPEQGPGRRALVQWLQLSAVPALQFYQGGELLWEHQGQPGLERALGEGLLFYTGLGAKGTEASQHVTQLATADQVRAFTSTSAAPTVALPLPTTTAATGPQPQVEEASTSSEIRVLFVATSESSKSIRTYPAVVALAQSFANGAHANHQHHSLDDQQQQHMSTSTAAAAAPAAPTAPAVPAVSAEPEAPPAPPRVRFARVLLGDGALQDEAVARGLLSELKVVEAPTFIFYRATTTSTASTATSATTSVTEVGRYVGGTPADLLGKVLDLVQVDPEASSRQALRAAEQEHLGLAAAATNEQQQQHHHHQQQQQQHQVVVSAASAQVQPLGPLQVSVQSPALQPGERPQLLEQAQEQEVQSAAKAAVLEAAAAQAAKAAEAAAQEQAAQLVQELQAAAQAAPLQATAATQKQVVVVQEAQAVSQAATEPAPVVVADVAAAAPTAAPAVEVAASSPSPAVEVAASPPAPAVEVPLKDLTEPTAGSAAPLHGATSTSSAASPAAASTTTTAPAPVIDTALPSAAAGVEPVSSAARDTPAAPTATTPATLSMPAAVPSTATSAAQVDAEASTPAAPATSTTSTSTTATAAPALIDNTLGPQVVPTGTSSSPADLAQTPATTRSPSTAPQPHTQIHAQAPLPAAVDLAPPAESPVAAPAPSAEQAAVAAMAAAVPEAPAQAALLGAPSPALESALALPSASTSTPPPRTPPVPHDLALALATCIALAATRRNALLPAAASPPTPLTPTAATPSPPKPAPQPALAAAPQPAPHAAEEEPHAGVNGEEAAHLMVASEEGSLGGDQPGRGDSLLEEEEGAELMVVHYALAPSTLMALRQAAAAAEPCLASRTKP